MSLTMNREHIAQVLIRCDLCETPIPQLHCDICNIHLCEDCVEEHRSDESKEHHVVPFHMRWTTSKCPKHSEKYCTLHCKQCNIPICSLCLSSSVHNQHDTAEIFAQHGSGGTFEKLQSRTLTNISFITLLLY